MDISSIDHHHLPPSSEATNTKASEASANPNAARWRVPNSVGTSSRPLQRQDQTRIGDPLALNKHSSIMNGRILAKNRFDERLRHFRVDSDAVRNQVANRILASKHNQRPNLALGHLEHGANDRIVGADGGGRRMEPYIG